MLMFSILDFINDTEELEGYIIGRAGTGKTTATYSIVQELIQAKISFKVVAYTHKAKEVLINKLPTLSVEYITTLHSFLKKRPTINSTATTNDNIMYSRQYGEPEPLRLLIVDELSFIGEQDYMSLGELHDKFKLHILYVGDTNQLNPIKGFQAVIPHKPYLMELTKVYRQDSTNNILVDTIQNVLNGDITIPKQLLCNNIVDEYIKDNNTSKTLLAYTNKAVQQINKDIHGYAIPKVGDRIAIYDMRKTATIVEIHNANTIDTLHSVNGIIDKDTKYNPLRTILSLPNVVFYTLDTNETIACIFGTYANKIYRNHLATELTKANSLGKNSKKQYKIYKIVNDYICTVDYTYCTTIHKAQGQEWDNVYIDYTDLTNRCSNKPDILRLLYVALSRAKSLVLLS